jgi:signal transduction histidine kinase
LNLFDWFVPPSARDDARARLRYRGIAKSLFAISLFAALMLGGFVAARGALEAAEYAAFAGAIAIPSLGALYIRLTGNIGAGLVATNVGGVLLVTFWALMTGGMDSATLPIFLGNLALLATFGDRRLLIAIGSLLLAALVFLYFATTSGRLPPSVVPDGASPLLMLIGMGTAVIGVVFAAAFTLREREQTKAQLRAARDAAERASRAKSAFLSSMSHELRTPLTTIIGSAELLGLERGDSLGARRAQLVRHIANAGEHLLSLVDQVLDMNAIEANALVLRREPVRANKAIDACLRMLEPLAHEKEVALRNRAGDAGEREVLVDRARLREVLLNLLSNAIKYNRESGTVTVACEARDAATLRISVIDTGRGIPAARQAEIFAPFARLGAEGGPIGGSGLGLSLTRRLTEMMGGRIGFVSSPDAGSTFWVEFPFIEPAAS